MLGPPPAVDVMIASGLTDWRVLVAHHLPAVFLDVSLREVQHAAPEGVIAANEEVGLGMILLHEIVDDRRDLLVWHPGIHIHVAIARVPFIKGRIDERNPASRHARQPRIARRTRFRRDQDIDLLVEDERIVCLLATGGATAIVGGFDADLTPENAALRIDFIDGELSRLQGRWRDYTGRSAQRDRNSDLDRVCGMGCLAGGQHRNEKGRG
jgi:hypothetical protein